MTDLHADDSKQDFRRSPPLPVRAAVALVLAALALWCAWSCLRAGASRTVSRYALRTGSKEAAEVSVALAPSDPEAHASRAAVLAYLGEHAAAAGAYEEALRLRPRDYVMWVELGRARDEAGDGAGALEAFRRAVGLAPFYARPRWQLGNALLRAGARGEASAELRRAAGSDPSLYPNLVQTLWHASGRDAGALVRDASPRTPEETLAVVRFLIKEGEADAGLRALGESGLRLAEESRKQLVTELLAAERFADAFALWSEGRGAVGTLADGGFEGEVRSDEEGFGWRFAKGEQGVRLSLDTDAPREGGRSLKVEYAGGSDPAQPAVSRLVVSEPGARYRLTFAARTKELKTGGPPFFEVAAALKTGGTLAETPTLPDSTDGWREFTLEFTAPPTGAVRLALRRKPCSSAPCPAFGAVWLDAFELRRIN